MDEDGDDGIDPLALFKAINLVGERQPEGYIYIVENEEQLAVCFADSSAYDAPNTGDGQLTVDALYAGLEAIGRESAQKGAFTIPCWSTSPGMWPLCDMRC